MDANEQKIAELRLSRIQAATARMARALEALFMACADLPPEEIERMKEQIDEAGRVLRGEPPKPEWTAEEILQREG
jgi:hypothetical protein